jgi:hypothetical protein
MTKTPIKLTDKGRSDQDQRGYRGKLFALLSDGKWHTNDEVSRVAGSGFHVGLYRLRSAGLDIDCERQDGVWRYRMIGAERSTRNESQGPMNGEQLEVGR